MPTYAYRREDGTTFDVFQRISDDALTEDPETGRPVVRMISGGAGLQFKGTGFYGTDYVKKTGTPDKEPSSDAKPAKTETKAESKPAAKTPAAAAKD